MNTHLRRAALALYWELEAMTPQQRRAWEASRRRAKRKQREAMVIG